MSIVNRDKEEKKLQRFATAMDRRRHQDVIPTACALLKDHVSYFNRRQFLDKLLNGEAEILPGVVVQDVLPLSVRPGQRVGCVVKIFENLQNCFFVCEQIQCSPAIKIFLHNAVLYAIL